MFKIPFYTILQIESVENSHTVMVQLNTTHPIYQGHFPEHAVVPGVCTLQIIKECVAKISHKELTYNTIPSCKFTSLIVPTKEPIELKLNLDDTLGCNANVLVNGSSVLKLKANFSVR
ncbi:MAG: hypothetical protein KBG80_00500 [Breznakibacter sp.]|nr:hypothetical protein [Breznakibacter sp.]